LLLKYLSTSEKQPSTSVDKDSVSHNIYNFEDTAKIIPPMIDTNTKFKNIDNEVIINKISKAAKDLNFTNDTMTFIKQMISLSLLLRMYDSPLPTTLRAIDEKTQDPSYFIATYFDTNDMDLALWVYRIVRLLSRYVLLYDRFFEIGDDRYALLAKKVHRSINNFLHDQSDKHHLVYSIDYAFNQFWTFWSFEQIIKRRILGGCAFSYKEIKHFNLSKSSDASIIYARVLDAMLPSFTENVSLILHYNQAFLDIQDDWEDLEEDVKEDMPNVFVMAAVEEIPYQIIKNSSPERIRDTIMNGTDSSRASIVRLVNEYQSSIRNISIPRNVVFLKSLSDRYAESLRETLSSSKS
jgi:hypothetical protein